MDILVVTARYPFGTAETFLEPELRWLCERGHRVRLAPLRRLGELRDLPAGVDLVSVGPIARARAIRSPSNAGSVLSGLARAGRRAAAARFIGTQVGAAVAKDPPDAVHGYWATAAAECAREVARILDVPWTFTAHGYDILADENLDEKSSAASAVRFISRYGWILAAALTRQPPPSHWRVIPLGVDIPSSDVTDVSPPPNLLCVGRLEPTKGQRVLLDAVRLARDRLPSGFQLQFVGDGTDTDALRCRARQIGVDTLVTFLGALPHEALLNALSPESVAGVVLPSYHEGIPVSLMEAIARRVPVVATDVGGVRELVTPGSGFVVGPGDPTVLADALVALLASPPIELRRMTSTALSVLRTRHDASATSVQFEALLAARA